jgi:predicted site-specific integrase-resolvase
MAAEMLKSEFAEFLSVSPAQISRWLKAGVIGVEALAGSGRRILVDLALAMLSERLPRSPLADLVAALARRRSLQAELDHLHTDEHALHARNVKNLLLAFVKGLRGHED